MTRCELKSSNICDYCVGVQRNTSDGRKRTFGPNSSIRVEICAVRSLRFVRSFSIALWFPVSDRKSGRSDLCDG